MHRGINEAREFPESWKGFGAQVANVVLGPTLKGYTAPVSRNHAALLFGTAPTVTTALVSPSCKSTIRSPRPKQRGTVVAVSGYAFG